MKPRLIVFDLDGTLVEFPFDHLFGAAEAILAELPCPLVTRDELEAAFSDFDFFRVVPPESRQPFAVALSAALDWRKYPPSTPFAQTERCLTRLRENGFRLALATSRDSPLQELEKQLKHTGLMKFFEFCAVRHGLSTDWSDKAPQLLSIAEQSGIAPGSMMMVGDSPRDISSAREAGVGLTAALLSGRISAAALNRADPHLLFDGIEELTEFLLKL